MELGNLIGYLGILCGFLVAPPQLYKLIKSKSNGVSKMTYIFLVLALTCYLIHAIYIQSIVFTIAQSLNLVVNGIILIVLIRRFHGSN